MFGLFKVWKAYKSGIQVHGCDNIYKFSWAINFICIIIYKIHENRDDPETLQCLWKVIYLTKAWTIT